MTPERAPLEELTAEQQDLASMLIEISGLEAVADEEMTMNGATATVRYGLGRCAQYMLDMQPVEINAWVMALLNKQPDPSDKTKD